MTETQQSPRGEPSFPPGRYLAPGLRLVRALGEGGQGRVMLAEDEKLHRSVAVKLLGGADRETAVAMAARVRVEGRAMAKVRHPAVVQVFDVGEVGGQPYLVMEFIDGQTLQDRLDQLERRMDVVEALALLEQIALGLQAVHDAGLAHGDLQPTNVIVGTDHRARVLDFGLAFLSGGTAHYMAPELQSDDTSADDIRARQRADLYALGVVAHELLTGERPFDAPDRARVLAQHRHKQPPSLAARRPDLDPALATVVDACLSKDPAERPARADEVGEHFAVEMRRLHRPSFRRLLLVDDDPALRALVRAHVEGTFEGVQVVEAADGAEAIAACQQRPFDLVVFDLHMPGVNGVELAGALRADEHAPRLLVLTGRGSAADWALLHSLGVSALLAKPLEPEVLKAELARALYGE